MKTKLIKKFLAKKGLVQGGVWIVEAAEMIADQKTWPDEDLRKMTDFTTSKWWLITDNGMDPIGINADQDLLKEIDL